MKKKALTKVVTVFDKGIDILAFVAGVVLVLMWGIVCSEVILRFLFNYSIIWGVEVSEFSLIFITFTGAAWLLKSEGHIKVDIVYSALNPRAQAFTNIITSIIGAAICAFLLKYGILVTIEQFEGGVVSFTVMRFPTWPRYAVISLGSLLLFFQFLRRAHINLMLLKRAGEKNLLAGNKDANPCKVP